MSCRGVCVLINECGFNVIHLTDYVLEHSYSHFLWGGH